MGRLNKPAREGYTYRSPDQTNAKDITPNLREDVIASQNADNERMKRGFDTSETRPQNRSQVQNAAGRAITRTAGRAGAAQAALEAGYAAGRTLDENGIPFTGGVGKGIGKEMVEKSGLGRLAEKSVNSRDKVELSKNSKDRIDDEEVDNIVRGVNARQKSGEFSPERGNSEAMKKGGKVSASSRGDGIAQRGKTKGRMC
jgi:hypothetical protein